MQRPNAIQPRADQRRPDPDHLLHVVAARELFALSAAALRRALRVATGDFDLERRLVVALRVTTATSCQRAPK
jgi:hypothetical protein